MISQHRSKRARHTSDYSKSPRHREPANWSPSIGSLASSIGIREEGPGEIVAEAQILDPAAGAERHASSSIIAGGVIGIVGRIGADIGDSSVKIDAVDPLINVVP